MLGNYRTQGLTFSPSIVPSPQDRPLVQVSVSDPDFISEIRISAWYMCIYMNESACP